jgi:hypothetical protein
MRGAKFLRFLPLAAACCAIQPLYAATSAPLQYHEGADISLSGAPNGIVSYQGNILFVAVTVPLTGSTSTSTCDSSTANCQAQIDVFKETSGSYQQIGTVILNDTSVNSLMLTPDKTTLIASLEYHGLALVDVTDALNGNAVPNYVDQSNDGKEARAGSFQTAVTPDGNYAFVANEYGQLAPTSSVGNVGVVKLTRGHDGKLQGSPIGYIPLLGNTTPGLSVSRDGKRVYVVSEIVPANHQSFLSGTNDKRLVSTTCVQDNPQNQEPNGDLSVIDVSRATNKQNLEVNSNIISNSVLTNTAAACSPVRVEETKDGSSVWMTARGSNEVIQFDTQRLVTDPNHALDQIVQSNGLAPVGLKLIDDSKYMLVTNSDRFSESSASPGSGSNDDVNISLFDVSRTPALLLQTLSSGLFPRDIATEDHANHVFVTNWSSDTVTTLNRESY